MTICFYVQRKKDSPRNGRKGFFSSNYEEFKHVNFSEFTAHYPGLYNQDPKEILSKLKWLEGNFNC